MLLGIVILIALLLLLSQCGDDDDTPAGSATTPASTVTASPSASAMTMSPSAAPTSQAGSGQDGDAGTVTAGGTNLLGATISDTATSSAKLSSHAGQQAVGRGARVQSVPADEGFWIGTSAQDRLWIQLTGTGGESDYKVKQGDAVNFTGTVTAAPQGFAAKAGLNAAEGADQLTQQGVYLSVPSSSVKLFN